MLKDSFKNHKYSLYAMVELLAPVSDRVMLKAAIDAGADCVYFGLKKLNMRATARNFTLEELPEIVKQCHDSQVKVFLTVNTIVYDTELEDVKTVIAGAKAAEVDYIICWDMAVIQECKKQGMPFHISTQASVANTEAAKFYKELGAERIVLARECKLEDVKAIKQNAGIEIETFIHGAMCISVSGRCFMSQHLFNRSANRGDCLQPCRREYKIIDEENNALVLGEGYVMSPKDLCALPFIDKLIEAGIDCFKIEGRVRSPEYVKTVVSAYREAIDAYEKGQFNKELTDKLVKKLKTVYNRGFSNGFYLGLPTADDFTDRGGSKATTKKIYVGYVINFFKEPNVAVIKLEAGGIKKGDKIMIQGPTTGVQEQTIESMEINHEPVKEAEKQDVGVKLNFTARPNDKVFRIESNQ